MTMRTTALRTTVIITVVIAALAGCSTPSDEFQNPGATVCASAEELFSGPSDNNTPQSDDNSSRIHDEQPRLSNDAATLLSNALPEGSRGDIATLLGGTVDANDAQERLQEWAIRSCGIEVAFAEDGSTRAAQATPNDIRIGSEQGTTIYISGDANYALTACEAEVQRGIAPEVLVMDQFGVAVASGKGDGPCTLLRTRP